MKRVENLKILYRDMRHVRMHLSRRQRDTSFYQRENFVTVKKKREKARKERTG
jgi:hypothetical protein